MPTRTTIYLDEALVVRARRLVPARRIEPARQRAAGRADRQLEQAELEAQMREGYIATRQDRQH